MINGTSKKCITFDLFSGDKSLPGALPLHLIFINKNLPLPGEFCTTYDFTKGIVSIYENFKDFRASKLLGKIKINFCYTPFIDILWK